MITIKFKPGGEVIMEPTGYPGDTCKTATRPYEDAMRGRRSSHDVEPTEVERQTERQQQRASE